MTAEFVPFVVLAFAFACVIVDSAIESRRERAKARYYADRARCRALSASAEPISHRN